MWLSHGDAGRAGWGAAAVWRDRAAVTAVAGMQPRAAHPCSLAQTFNAWEGEAGSERNKLSVKQDKLMKDNFFFFFFCRQHTQRGKNRKLLRKRDVSELLSKGESTEKPCLAELL